MSTIKRTQLGPGASSYDAIGLKNASFRWNAVKEEEKDKDDKKAKGKKSPNTKASEPEADAASAITSTTAAEEEQRFELSNLSVVFPDGELSLVTGPTASGKTALLVSDVINVHRMLTDTSII